MTQVFVLKFIMVASELIMVLSCVILTLSGSVREVHSNEILDQDRNQTKVLSRRKRYVTFPEGASFSVSILNYRF